MIERLIDGCRLGEMTPVRKPGVWCYRQAPLYLRRVGGEFVLYKNSGINLEEMGVEPETLPRMLFLLKRDRLSSVAEVQTCLKNKLDRALMEGDPEKIKLILVQMLEEALVDPRAANLKTAGSVVSRLAHRYEQRPEALLQLAMLTQRDYTTAVHSVNVSVLALAYCLHYQYPAESANQMGLAGLLHDVGKIFVPLEILHAPRKLTSQEFAQVKTHPSRGYELLRAAGFGQVVLDAAVEHHEKLDGSGYPRGKRNLTPTGRLIGFLDAFEALTSDERVYRSALEPFACLSFLKNDVAQGKLDNKIFERFTACLV